MSAQARSVKRGIPLVQTLPVFLQSIAVGKKIVALTKDDIDFIVAYLVPLDLWYVVPVEEFAPRKNLLFYPMGSKKGAHFEKYREAWGC